MYDQWPATRGNHTEPEALARVNKLPEQIREHVWTNDPCWGYVPTGWVDLVVELHTKLVQLEPDYRIEQVKEKFGGLRYYVDIARNNDQAWDLIHEYEDRATEICDVCGAPGEVVNVKDKRYIAARCPEHVDDEWRAKVVQQLR